MEGVENVKYDTECIQAGITTLDEQVGYLDELKTNISTKKTEYLTNWSGTEATVYNATLSNIDSTIDLIVESIGKITSAATQAIKIYDDMKTETATSAAAGVSSE